MNLDFITRLASVLVAAFVVYKGWDAMNAVSGKTKKAIGFITGGMVVLGVLEFLGLIGFHTTLGLLAPLFWDLDIIYSLFMLAAIATLKAKK